MLAANTSCALVVVAALVVGCSSGDSCGLGVDPPRATFELSCDSTDLTSVAVSGPCETDAGSSFYVFRARTATPGGAARSTRSLTRRARHDRARPEPCAPRSPRARGRLERLRSAPARSRRAAAFDASTRAELPIRALERQASRSPKSRDRWRAQRSCARSRARTLDGLVAPRGIARGEGRSSILPSAVDTSPAIRSTRTSTRSTGTDRLAW